jgi:hypothetical protein
MFRRIVASALIGLSIFSATLVILPQTVAAEVAESCSSSMFLGLPSWYKYLDVGPKDNDKCAILGPNDSNGNFDWAAALPLIILALVEILLRLSALVAIGFVVVGGVKFITSQGEPDGLKQARGTIINALIGLVIAVSATALVSFIGRTIGG